MAVNSLIASNIMSCLAEDERLILFFGTVIAAQMRKASDDRPQWLCQQTQQ
jgi:hypothetical protein